MECSVIHLLVNSVNYFSFFSFFLLLLWFSLCSFHFFFPTGTPTGDMINPPNPDRTFTLRQAAVAVFDRRHVFVFVYLINNFLFQKKKKEEEFARGLRESKIALICQFVQKVIGICIGISRPLQTWQKSYQL